MVAGGMNRRIPVQHGRGSVVVRGSVTQVDVPKPIVGWMKWIKKPLFPVVTVTIDDGPYALLQPLLHSNADGAGVAKTFKFGWGFDTVIPKVADRVWITFGYSGPLETLLNRAPPVSLKEVEVIRDEWRTKEGEFYDPEPKFLV